MVHLGVVVLQVVAVVEARQVLGAVVEVLDLLSSSSYSALPS